MFCVSSPFFASVTVTVTPPLHDIYLRRDQPAQHMLSGFSLSDPDMTVEDCTSFCVSFDYFIAGIANGIDCCKSMSRSFPREVQFHDSPIF